MLSKGAYTEKLKEITKKVKNPLYSCCNCVYYNEEILHCQIKNRYLKNVKNLIKGIVKSSLLADHKKSLAEAVYKELVKR